jgi:methylase of polypeptide subunit release factors
VSRRAGSSYAPRPAAIADATRILGDTNEPLTTPTLDDPEAMTALGSLLAAAGYTEEGLQESFGAGGELDTAAAEVPAQRLRLRESGPRSSLIKLFFLGMPVSWQEAATALPGLDPDRLEATRVLEAVGDDLRARVRLVPHKDVLVAYEAGAGPPEGSDLLAGTTVRMHFASALNASAGSGLHALLAARHTDRVLAIDPDPRSLALTRLGAFLNGLDNVETLVGAGLEPAAGHSFGLIAANPPHVLSPDDDERADSLCRELVQAITARLSEGGFAHVLVTWVLGVREDWWAPLAHWVEGRGCDAFLLLERQDDPVAYAAAHAEDGQALVRWTGFLQDLAADRVGTGAIVLRRRTRADNWTRHEALPTGRIGPAGDQIVRAFVNHDLLAALPTEDQLLDEVLAVVEPQHIEQTWRHKDEGLGLESARVRLDWGLGFALGIDTYTIELLARLDGKRRLRDLFAEIAHDAQLEEDSVARAGLPAVLRLLELGFLARV